MWNSDLGKLEFEMFLAEAKRDVATRLGLIVGFAAAIFAEISNIRPLVALALGIVAFLVLALPYWISEGKATDAYRRAKRKADSNR